MNLVKLGLSEAAATLAVDKDGVEHILVVAKKTFEVRGEQCVPATHQVPLTFADQYLGQPGMSSVLYESDFAIAKCRTDVLINGRAFAPGGNPVPSIDVGVEIGSCSKKIRVFGNRYWDFMIGDGFFATDPEPFLEMPITYERAFGGRDGGTEGEFEQRNLVGIGFHTKQNRSIVGSPLPNLERPEQLQRSPTARVEPIGYGVVSRNWLPRRAYAGSFNEAWLEHVFPFLPENFKPEYFQAAPPDQCLPLLRGGEFVRLTNLSPGGSLTFRLPETSVSMQLLYRTRKETLAPKLDTVILEPAENRCVLVWRASAPLTSKLTNLLEVWVGEPTYARLRALQTGKRFIDFQAASKSYS